VADLVHVSIDMDDWPDPAVAAVVDGLTREAGPAHAIDVVLESVRSGSRPEAKAWR
jgi:hypothetical protein